MRIKGTFNFKNRMIMKTANDYYYGIRGVRFIWHGEWADPEVSYKGYLVDEIELSDTFWADFLCECRERGENTGNYSPCDEVVGARFDGYMRAHAREVKAYIMNYGCKC